MKPPLAKLTVSEPTYAALGRVFWEGVPSLGLFSDEGAQFIGGHGMGKDHRVSTAGGLCKLWDSGDFERIRVGDSSSTLPGIVLLPGRRLSVHLMVQPDIATIILADPLLNNQGFSSRLLVSQPDSIAGSRLRHDVGQDDEAAILKFGERMLAILRTPLPLREGTADEPQPRLLLMADDAKKLWYEFADEIERGQGKGGELEPIRYFASKAPEHAARLGSGQQLHDDLEAPVLDGEHLETGITLTKYYLKEWLRLCHAGSISPELRRAQRLLAWLQTDWSADLVSTPDCYQRIEFHLPDCYQRIEFHLLGEVLAYLRFALAGP